MIPTAVIRTLMCPKLEAHQFGPTKWDSAEDKALFGNRLLKFMAEDFPKSSFTQKFYTRLSLTFGNIAHTNKDGFDSTCFETTSSKIEFLDQIISWPCWGDPQHTYCDLERAVIKRLRTSGLADLFQRQLSTEIRTREIRMLEQLKQKYEPKQDSIPCPGYLPFAPSHKPMTQTSFFDLLPGKGD